MTLFSTPENGIILLDQFPEEENYTGIYGFSRDIYGTRFEWQGSSYTICDCFPAPATQGVKFHCVAGANDKIARVSIVTWVWLFKSRLV